MKDKIIFWIDGALTHFCLAHYLQKKYDADYYAIIDAINKPKKFFQEQQFVKFQKVWYYHDHIAKNKVSNNDYLSSFEKKYKINIWELAINERLFYRFNRIYKFSTTEILSILEQECRLFEKILDEIKPDFFITKEPPLHHHELFYRLCRAKGVRVLMLNQPNLSKCIISEEAKKVDSIENMHDITIKHLDFDELRKYRNSLTMYNKIKYFRKNFLTSKTGLFKASIDFLSSNNEQIKTHYTYAGRTKIRVILDTLVILLKKRIRKYFIDKNLLTEIKYNEKFVYFPLGVDQERNLLILAPFYTNQIEVIRHVAKSLPVDYKIYVKENPAEEVRRWKPISQYREIMDIPNVRLFHPSFPAESLYENCSLVITISGSSGLEAAFYKKPSIVFADVGYAVLPSVHRIDSPEKLPNAIRTSLQKNVAAADLEKYIMFLDNNSFDFDIHRFEIEYNNCFYFGGNLANVHIPIYKMQSFLEQNKTILEKLADEHIKKLVNIKNSKKDIFLQ
jgi:hypothetical protein